MSPAAPFAVPTGIGWTRSVDDDGGTRIFVSPLPNGPVAVLPGESALIWLAAVEGSGEVVDSVARTTGLPVDSVREDVESFLEELLHRGLLVRSG